MNRMHMLEDSCTAHRQRADALQKRLSERHQECRSLEKHLFRARESARIANEVADKVERELEAIGMAYDVLRESNIVQTARITELENQGLWKFLQGWMHRLILNSCTTEAIYYGLPR